MTTTNYQKALILRRWKAHRSERGLRGDVRAQIKFNWPSLSSDDRSAVLKVYSEDVMKRKHIVSCELGERRYSESFVSDAEARAFIDLVLGEEKFKWKSPTMITAKDGVLIVKGEDLEDLMELEPPEDVELPEPIPRTVERFLRGKWLKVEAELAAATPAVAKSDDAGGSVTLAELCERHKWDPHEVRVAMRKAKWSRPGAGWRWAKSEGIERKLSKLMS